MDATVIEDGQVAPPVVGDVGRYWLSFHEAKEESDDAAVVAFQAYAEPDGEGAPTIGTYRLGYNDEVFYRPPTWFIVLRGDGWTAGWSAPRPVTGETLLTGYLLGDFNLGGQGSVRGRITRARVVTQDSVAELIDHGFVLRPVPGGQRLRDVQAAPRSFEHGGAPGLVDGMTVTGEQGVLVDLDLDDVPPLPLRPRFVPWTVSASGQDVWVADDALPTVLRVRDNAEVSMFSWPGHINAANHVYADEVGCWATGRGGVVRCNDDGGARVVDRGACYVAASANGTLAAMIEIDVRGSRESQSSLRMFEPSGKVTEVTTGELRVHEIRASRDGFLILCTDNTDRGPWLARLEFDGGLTHGPILDENVFYLGRVLGADPAIAGSRRALRPVLPDLSLGDPVTVPGNVLDGWATDGRVWILTHPYYEAGPEGWQALTRTWPEGRQHSALHELDPDTLQPIVTTLIPGQPTHLSADGAGVVWVVMANGLYRCPPHSEGVTEPFDLAGLLDGPPGAQ